MRHRQDRRPDVDFLSQVDVFQADFDRYAIRGIPIVAVYANKGQLRLNANSLISMDDIWPMDGAAGTRRKRRDE